MTQQCWYSQHWRHMYENQVYTRPGLRKGESSYYKLQVYDPTTLVEVELAFLFFVKQPCVQCYILYLHLPIYRNTPSIRSLCIREKVVQSSRSERENSSYYIVQVCWHRHN